MKRMKFNLSLKLNPFTTAIYLYLILPFLIFLFGWTKWYIAVPIAAIVLFCAWRMQQGTPVLWMPERNKKNLEKLIFVVLIVLLWVYLSGIGGMVYQNDDHIWRNAMFNSLVSEEWPVVSTVDMDGEMVSRGITYYIGFWMPAALVGKLLGIQAGYYFQAIWAVIGILLFYYCVCAVRKKLEIWPLLIFVFFSGLDILGCYVTGWDVAALPATSHLEWWSGFQFSSFTTQLFWVFNQAIPAWLITMLLYLQKNNKYCIFILAFSMLNSTLPFVGMLPFLAYWMLSRKYEGVDKFKNWLKVWAKDTFTIENILGGGVVGILSFLYLTGNAGENGTFFIDMNMGLRLKYVIFILIEVGIYWLFAYYYHKKEVLLYLILGWLCFCPLFEMGGGQNFCMRASIPALVLLFLYILRVFERSYQQRQKLIFGGLAAVFFIGSVTASYEMIRTITYTNNRYKSRQQITAEPVELEDVLTNDYESADIDISRFYKYIAK